VQGFFFDHTLYWVTNIYKNTGAIYIVYPIFGGGFPMHGCCTSRSFLTKDEKIEMLTEYKEELEKEAQGVGERIKELEKAS